MPRSPRHRRRLLLAAVSVLGVVAASACGALRGTDDGAAGGDAAPSQTVVIALPGWTGGQATAGMATYLLEEEWGMPVELRATGQEAAWDALATGGIHAVMEDWGTLPEQTDLYVERKGNVTDAGSLGITGQVGWYVPRDFAEEHPEVLDATCLDEYAGEFSGRLLEGDPHHATHDAALIEDLGLDLRREAVGSEAALIEEITAAAAEGTGLLAYFWRPHWLHTEVDLAEIELPGGYYPAIEPRKYLNTHFLRTGGEAAAFLRDFTWTEREQNEVARFIAEGMSPRAAAEQWAGAHPGRVAKWLGQRG